MSRLVSSILAAAGLIVMAFALLGCAEKETKSAGEAATDVESEEVVMEPDSSFIAVEPTVVTEARPRDALRIGYANVAVTLDGDLAKTVVTEVLVNDTTMEAEATFRFPLPRDATVTDFAHYKDGARVAAAIGGKKEAQKEYDRAVRAGEKAAIAEEKGRFFEMTLAPIAAGGQRRVELSYTQTLSALGGERTYALPAQRFSEHVPTLLDVDVEIRGSRELAAARAPNHPDARIVRRAAKRMSVHLARSRMPLGRDFVVSWNQPTSEIELDGRSAIRGEKQQFSEFRFAFNRDPLAAERPVTSVVLVLDRSLSMAGGPMARAQELAASVLDRLGDADQVGMVDFASSVSTRSMAPASKAHVDSLKRRVADLSASGHSSLAAALDEAIAMVKGKPGALIVVATDGQPTVGDFTDESAAATAIDVEDSRVVIAHFNYPSRSDTLATLFPAAKVHFIPNGDAADEAIANVTKLAIAPTIENLEINITGVETERQVGGAPTRLALGESVRLLAPSTGAVAISVRGRLHGKPVAFEKTIAAPGSASELGGAIATEWARLRIAELERRLHDDTDNAAATEIRQLGMDYRLATRFTSFVVTEIVTADEPFEDDGDELSPDRIKPGDPEIRVRAPQSANRVFGVLPWGEIIECEWQDDEGLWLGRFLVPRHTPDGLYKIRVFVAGQSKTTLRSTLLYRVDSAPPTFSLEASYSGGVISLRAVPIAEVFDKVGDSIRLDRVDLKKIVVRIGNRDDAETVELAADGEVWTASKRLRLDKGRHELTLTAIDYAANSSQAKTTLGVSR